MAANSAATHGAQPAAAESERLRRANRPLAFRVMLRVAGHIGWFGTWQRRSMYAHLSRTFIEQGLHAKEVDAVAKNYSFDADGCRANEYVPEHRGLDRFLGLWITDSNATAFLSQATGAVLEPYYRWLNEQGRKADMAKVDVSPPNLYHITVFHTSKPTEPVPRETVPLEQKLELARSETTTIAKTFKTFLGDREIGLSLGAITVSTSGTVLALWHVDGVNIERLRDACIAPFPDAPHGQTQLIVHSTLARIMVSEQIPETVRAAMIKAADESTALWERKVGDNEPQVPVTEAKLVVTERHLRPEGTSFSISLPAHRGPPSKRRRWSSPVTIALVAAGAAVTAAAAYFVWKK